MGPGYTSNEEVSERLEASMSRPLSRAQIDKRVIFEMDSPLLDRQVTVFSRWRAACRSDNFWPHSKNYVRPGQAFTDSGVHWLMRHIYSEYM